MPKFIAQRRLNLAPEAADGQTLDNRTLSIYRDATQI
jgi:hypothetical protein